MTKASDTPAIIMTATNSLQYYRPIVHAICERERISYSALSPGYESTAAVFLLDNRFALKVHRGDNCHAVERAVLEELSAVEELPIPCVRAAGVIDRDGTWSYILMDQVLGSPLRDVWPHIDEHSRRAIAAELGCIICTLHHSLTEPLKDTLDSQGRGWQEVRQKLDADRRDLISRIQSAPPDRPALHFWYDLIQLLETARVPTSPDLLLTHQDLTEDHLYVLRRDGRWRVSGLIDFGDAALGPRQLDWPDLRFCMFDRDSHAMQSFWHSYHGSGDPDEDLPVCLALTAGSLGFLQWLPVWFSRCEMMSLHNTLDLQDRLWPRDLLGDQQATARSGHKQGA